MPARRNPPREEALDVRRLEREAARHERAGRLREALAALERIAAAGRAGGDLLNRCGDLSQRLGEADRAIASWAAAAERLREEGFVHKALAILRKAVRRDPGRVALLVRIADLHAELGHVAEARRLSLDVAQRLLEAGRDDEAFALLERLLEVEADPDTRHTLARLCEQRGRVDAAISHYVALAADLGREGRLPEAREALERALALAPGQAAVTEPLAELYARLGLWALALPLNEALAASTGAVAAVHALARNYAELGRVDEAERTYGRLLKLQPDDQWRARIALLRVTRGDADRALEDLEPVLARLESRDRHEQAADLLEELLGHAPDHLRSLLRLASLYNRTGARAAFARCYERIEALHRERGEAALADAAAEVLAAARQPHRFDQRQPRRPAVARATGTAAALDAAAGRIRGATGLIIAAGAGLNVAYGWPDYRDPEAFWAVFPEYRGLGLTLAELARPGRFQVDPAMAWGFYAARIRRAREREPHEGLTTLSRWRALCPAGGYVVTSCVEGEYEAAGFAGDRIVECCGNILWLQCAADCGATPFPAPERLADPGNGGAFPRCAACNAPARPNVLLFGDWSWDMSRLEAQDERFREWLGGRRGLVVLELGETPRLPVLRAYVRRFAEQVGADLVRISAHDASVPEGGLGLAMSPREALEAINERLRAR
ncbi:MAG: tetratricopeptide repeat protein [Vicinamibacteria bacterium]|nr:tetratricopeptide repeat protein [Vicinamibacteria bacterium]